MTKLLAIFAHPDDEGAIGGTLASAAQNGVDTALICATRGEAGEINDPDLATAENMGEVRAAELREACDVLGIGELRFLDYRDSGMEGTPENNDPRALVQADEEEAVERLVSLLQALQPDVVVTFEPFGWYGHPDHIAVSRLATKAYDRVAGDGSNFSPDEERRPTHLFYAVLPFSMFQKMTDFAREHGFLDDDEFEPREEAREAEASITHVLDLRDLIDVKLEAMWKHRTQFGDDNWFRKIPPDMLRELWGMEYFIQVRPEPAERLLRNHADDLFA